MKPLVTKMTLNFPYGATTEQCEQIAYWASRAVKATVSECGPEIKESSPGSSFVRKLEDTLTFTYGIPDEVPLQ